MKVLVVGGGGREHALINALKRNNSALDIICAPGNGGIACQTPCFNVSATDISGMVALAKSEKVDFVVVTPDDPLALGMVDAMEEAGIPAFGPTKNAARIEASKVFAKQLMRRANIPTAESAEFDSAEQAREYVLSHGAPIVIKADGLARGKGVIVAMTTDEAIAAIDSIMLERTFGSAGATVLIEEYLTGTEMSLMCFSDGEHISVMPSSQDHKRLLDGDMGPNTGGMGAFSPSPLMTPELWDDIKTRILIPAIRDMKNEGCPFRGVLYAGLMITERGPYVLEFNARFGDPETQVVLPLLESDLIEIMSACREGKLDSLDIKWSDDACAVIILASGGYPESHKTGYEISGLDGSFPDGGIIHAGTKYENGRFYTAGGRVLGVFSRAQTLPEAIERAYSYAKGISFTDMVFRSDIGRTCID